MFPFIRSRISFQEFHKRIPWKQLDGTYSVPRTHLWRFYLVPRNSRKKKHSTKEDINFSHYFSNLMGIPRVCYHRTVWDHKLVHIPRVIKEVTLPAISSSFIQRVSTGVRFRAIRLDSLTCSSKSQERPSRTRSSSAYFARRISKHRGRCLKGWFWKLADTKSMLSDNLIRKLQQANVIGVLGFEDKETRYMKSEVGNRKNKEKKISKWNTYHDGEDPRIEHRIPGFG